jgi:hypothetical protein
MFVLLVSGSFYDKIKHFSNNGICGLLGETHFSTLHNTVVVAMKRAWKIEEGEEFLAEIVLKKEFFHG